mgnify:CR=1 FL=1
MKNFRTYNLALASYKKAKSLSLKGALRDQFERASLSVVLNLNEGSAKFSRKDRKKFYNIALGSFRECQSILEIIENKTLLEEADVLGAHLYMLAIKT